MQLWEVLYKDKDKDKNKDEVLASALQLNSLRFKVWFLHCSGERS